MSEITYQSLLENIPFWEHLSEEDRSLVLSRQSTVRYRAGQQVRGGNMDCLGFIIVLSGMLRAHLLSPDGRDITLYRIRPGESCVLAASCVLDAVSFETQVDAEEDSEILLIPIDVYSLLIRNNIYVECATYKMATERFSDVVAGVERLVFMSLEQRIVSFLLDEASQTGSGEVHMTQEQIAVNIGSAREAVSRALKSMAEQGLVELFRGGVRLIDKTALYQLLG